MRRQLLRPIGAHLHRQRPGEWRLVRLERLLGDQLRRQRHADAGLQQPHPSLRRQHMHRLNLAHLHRTRLRRRRLGDRRMGRLERLQRFDLQSDQKPHRHLLARRLRRCRLRPVDQASDDADERLPKPCLDSGIVERRPLQCDRLRRARHADPNPVRRLPLRRQRLPGTQAACVRDRILYRKQPEGWRLGERRMGSLERLQQFDLQSKQKPHRHLLTSRLRRCGLRPVDQAGVDGDEYLHPSL